MCGGPVGASPRGNGRYMCRAGKHERGALGYGAAWVDMSAADEWIDHLAIEWLTQPAALALLDSTDDAGAREAILTCHDGK